MAASTGSTRLSVAASPPTIKTSSPFSAPHVPPVTGASRYSTPRAAASAAIRFARTTDTVLESTSTLPRRNASRAPPPHSTASSAAGSLTMVIKISACAAASRALDATFAPDFANSSVLLLVRFHMTTGNSAFSKIQRHGPSHQPQPDKPNHRFRHFLPPIVRVACSLRDRRPAPAIPFDSQPAQSNAAKLPPAAIIVRSSSILGRQAYPGAPPPLFS